MIEISKRYFFILFRTKEQVYLLYSNFPVLNIFQTIHYIIYRCPQFYNFVRKQEIYVKQECAYFYKIEIYFIKLKQSRCI